MFSARRFGSDVMSFLLTNFFIFGWRRDETFFGEDAGQEGKNEF